MKPTANNSLNPLGVFQQRKFYVNEAFPRNRVAIPFNTWDERHLHGKIDRKNNAIVLKRDKLVLVSSQNGVFLPDFFNQAFREFRTDIQRRKAKGSIDVSNTFLEDLEPKKGWVNVETQFEEFLSSYYGGLATFLLQKHNSEKLKDFSTFIKLFVFYFERANSQHLPITFSGFVASKFSYPNIGGLTIEFANKSYDVDEKKFDEFLESDVFKLYTELAESYGMKVDIYVPWRLIADIESPIMKRRFMSQHTNRTSLDEFLEDYYNKAFYQDLKKLQETLFRFYSSFIIANPSVKIIKNGKTITQNREPITLERIKQKPITFWMRLYTFLRARETNFLTTQGTFDNLVQDAVNLFTIFGENKAKKHINTFLGGVPRQKKESYKNFRY